MIIKKRSPYKYEKQEVIGLLKLKITVEKKVDAERASTERSQEEKKVAEAQAAAVAGKDAKPQDKFSIVDEVNNTFKFNLHKKEFMQYILDTKDLKFRAYIIQCHNLSAVDSYSDIKATMAGYSAKCSANPFMELEVGSGSNSGSFMRYIEDTKGMIPSSLNPKFKATYNMDVFYIIFIN